MVMIVGLFQNGGSFILEIQALKTSSLGLGWEVGNLVLDTFSFLLR